MKGQYRVILETLLILIGIFVTGYVISNFEALQAKLNTVSAGDNFNTIANEVSIGMVTASRTDSGIVKINIPEKVAGHVYKISLSTLNGGMINVSSVDNPTLYVDKKIFNIGQTNKIISSQVISSSRVIEIITENGQIKIRRGI